MLVLTDHFLAKIRPAISPEIHDNIIGGRQSRPQKQRCRRPPAAATFVFFNYIVMNISRDGLEISHLFATLQSNQASRLGFQVEPVNRASAPTYNWTVSPDRGSLPNRDSQGLANHLAVMFQNRTGPDSRKPDRKNRTG